MAEKTSFDEVKEDWDSIRERIQQREEEFEDNITQGETAGIADSLSRTVENWESGRKSLRTLPVLNTVEEYTGSKADKETRRTMVGLDAYINNLDDIIDTQNPEKQEKVELGAAVAFAGPLTFLNTPEPSEVNLEEIAVRYLTDVFQIPHEENKRSSPGRYTPDLKRRKLQLKP